MWCLRVSVLIWQRRSCLISLVRWGLVRRGSGVMALMSWYLQFCGVTVTKVSQSQTYESFNQQVFFNEKCVVGYHQPIHAHHHLRSTRLIIYGSRVKVKESLLNKCQLHIFPNFYSSLFFKYHNKYRHTMKILKSLHPQLMVSVSECRE